jgi:hypothetical protein
MKAPLKPSVTTSAAFRQVTSPQLPTDSGIVFGDNVRSKNLYNTSPDRRETKQGAVLRGSVITVEVWVPVMVSKSVALAQFHLNSRI